MTLLVGFVLIVAGVISRLLIDAATALPIDGRPLPFPPAAHSSQTNSVPSPVTAGTILLIVTNAEYFIEGDVDKSSNLIDWLPLAHLSLTVPEQDGASASAGFTDGDVSGALTALVTSGTSSTCSGFKLKHPNWQIPNPPKQAFYRLRNLQEWRNEFYTTTVSSGPPQ